MAVLSISNGKNEKESVEIISGEVWKIDKYTTKCEDSYEVRRLNQSQFKKFQLLYPTAGRGSVRLFLPSRWNGESKEWIVFYAKHRIAFTKILCDEDFMDYYVRCGSRYLTGYELNVIENYPQHLHHCMELFCYSLLEKDEKENNCKEGGPLYFGFMRDILYQYFKYSKAHNAKSIDQLYAEHYSQMHLLSSSVLQSRDQIKEENVRDSHAIEEQDPDYAIYDAMDRVENSYSRLQEFLSNPNFERYYGDIFNDSYLFILGNAVQEYEQKEIYKKWYSYGERGFDGTVVCPAIFKNSSYIDKFENATIVFFCVFGSDSELEKMLSLAIMNHSEVIIQLYDASLYPRYSKKYPQATILLAGVKDEDTLLDETDTFMIECYNRVRGKGYQK